VNRDGSLYCRKPGNPGTPLDGIRLGRIRCQDKDLCHVPYDNAVPRSLRTIERPRCSLPTLAPERENGGTAIVYKALLHKTLRVSLCHCVASPGFVRGEADSEVARFVAWCNTSGTTRRLATSRRTMYTTGTYALLLRPAAKRAFLCCGG
jgi:hypothetical protein